MSIRKDLVEEVCVLLASLTQEEVLALSDHCHERWKFRVDKRTPCTGCDTYGYGPHACPGKSASANGNCNLYITSPGRNIFSTVKAVMSITGLDTKTAREVVLLATGGNPKPLKEDICLDDAMKYYAILRETGAGVLVEKK